MDTPINCYDVSPIARNTRAAILLTSAILNYIGCYLSIPAGKPANTRICEILKLYSVYAGCKTNRQYLTRQPAHGGLLGLITRTQALYCNSVKGLLLTIFMVQQQAFFLLLSCVFILTDYINFIDKILFAIL